MTEQLNRIPLLSATPMAPRDCAVPALKPALVTLCLATLLSLLTEIVSRGPAEIAGLAVGDVITAIDGKPLKQIAEKAELRKRGVYW